MRQAPEITIPGTGPVAPETFFGFHPLALNVIVLGDLGAPAAPYSSDSKGAAAVAGDVFTSSFSLNDLGTAPEGVSLDAGGITAHNALLNLHAATHFELIGGNQVW